MRTNYQRTQLALTHDRILIDGPSILDSFSLLLMFFFFFFLWRREIYSLFLGASGFQMIEGTTFVDIAHLFFVLKHSTCKRSEPDHVHLIEKTRSLFTI
jgi:hypothetical protein